MNYYTLWAVGLWLCSSIVAATPSLYQTSWQWQDDNDRAVTLSEWQGKTVFLTMAYSTCRKTCLTTVQKLKDIQAQLDTQHRSAEFVIVSYDAGHESSKTWSEYRDHHDLHRANWHFLTGSEQDTRALATTLGVDYWSYDEHILHDFKIIMLDPSGAVIRTFDWNHRDVSHVLDL